MGYLGYLIAGSVVLLLALVLLVRSRRRVGPLHGMSTGTAAEFAEIPPGRPQRRTNRLLLAAGGMALLASAALFFCAWQAHSATSGGSAPPAPNADEAPLWAGGQAGSAAALADQPLPPDWVRSIPSSPGPPVYDLPLVIKVDLPSPPPDDIAKPSAPGGAAQTASGKGSSAPDKTPTTSVSDALHSLWSGLNEMAQKVPKPPAPQAKPTTPAGSAAPTAAPATPPPK